MHKAVSRHDRLAFRLTIIISRLLEGETLDVHNLKTEFGVSLRTLRRDFSERLIYLDLEYRKGFCRLASGARQQRTEKDVLEFARRIGISNLLPGLDGQMVNALLSADGSAPCIIWPPTFQSNHASLLSTHFCKLIDSILAKQRVLLLTQTCRYEGLAPYRLMFYDARWYVVGECRERIEVIVVDDIDALIVTNERYEPFQAMEELIARTHFVAVLPHYHFISEVLLPFHSQRNK